MPVELNQLPLCRSVPVTMPVKSQRSTFPWRGVACLTIASASLFYSGCLAVVAAGAAGTGVAWYSGRMETTLDHNLNDVYAAAQEAIAQLQLVKVSGKKSEVDAELIARTALDRKVDITLERTSRQVTKVGIRVGIFGNEDLSLTLLDKIKSNL